MLRHLESVEIVWGGRIGVSLIPSLLITLDKICLEKITQVIKNYLSLLLSEDQIFFLMKEELKDIKNNIFLYRKTKIKRYNNKIRNKYVVSLCLN